MGECEAQVLLIGDTTANPTEILIKEIKYAISNQWYILGIKLSNRSGAAPDIALEYKYYHKFDNNFPSLVSNILNLIPCT